MDRRVHLTAILFCKAALLLLFILFGPLGLGPDEAQYWTWSKHLDIGYYSKPPGIAYQIKAGTALFGNSELGVRLFSLFIGFFQPVVLFGLIRKYTQSEEKAFWSALAWAFCPIGMIGSFLAITDIAMILFLTMALFVYFKEGPTWPVGILIGLGALFKWPIYFFWVWICVEELFFRKRKVPFGAILLSLIGLVPSAIWSLFHEGATFRHVAATIQGRGETMGDSNPISFIMAQVALVSPIFFYGMFRSKSWNFFSRSFYFSLAGAVCLSFIMKLQGNWAIFIYPLGFVLLADWIDRKKALSGVGVSLLLIGIIFVLPYKSSPLKQMLGVRKIGSALVSAGFEKGQFIASDSYQMTSQASFYNPYQQIAYFVNLDGRRLNQFSFWPQVSESRQQNGWFLSDRENLLLILTPLFEEVAPPISHDLFDDKKKLYLYKVKGFKSREPLFLKQF